jgi:DNA invertase Pin-like site-specific DNA recombinase
VTTDDTNRARPVPAQRVKRPSKAARARAAACVVIYVRVSTEEQAKNGAGLDAQLTECRAYASAQGWAVVDEVVEVPISGKVAPDRRPGFGRALQILNACDAGLLLVRRIDRISRRLEHQLAVFAAAGTGTWAIATPDGKVNTASAQGRFQLQVLAAAAEYELGLIGERTAEGMAAKRAAGVRLGRPSSLSTRPDVLARVVAEREAGRTLAAIAAGLNDDGIPNPSGSPAGWHLVTVQRALRTAAQDRAAHRRSDKNLTPAPIWDGE